MNGAEMTAVSELTLCDLSGGREVILDARERSRRTFDATPNRLAVTLQRCRGHISRLRLDNFPSMR